MAKYVKKPVVIEAITFDEFVQYGIDSGADLHDGIPWYFEYNGHPVTHEDENCYLLPTLEGTMKFTREDMLITGVDGEIYPCKISIFDKTYEMVEENNYTKPSKSVIAGNLTMNQRADNSNCGGFGTGGWGDPPNAAAIAMQIRREISNGRKHHA